MLRLFKHNGQAAQSRRTSASMVGHQTAFFMRSMTLAWPRWLTVGHAWKNSKTRGQAQRGTTLPTTKGSFLSTWTKSPSRISNSE